MRMRKGRNRKKETQNRSVAKIQRYSNKNKLSNLVGDTQQRDKITEKVK